MGPSRALAAVPAGRVRRRGRGVGRGEGGEPPDVQVDVGELSFPDVGDEVIAFRAALSFAVAGREVDLPFDVIFVRSGRSIGFYVFGNLGEPFRPRTPRAAIESALARAA